MNLFAEGRILWLLPVVVAALVAFFWWSWRERQRLMAQFIQARLLPGLIAGVSFTRYKIRVGLIIGAVVCLILALARPQWGYFDQEVAQKGLDIMVAVDTSKSMLAADIAPNRLERAKMAARGLMQEAKSDRLGLVAFAGSAFLVCPLTIDDNAFLQTVNTLDVNTISEGGTSLAEAINTAARAFKEGDNFKVLVLFTDGEDNDEGALEAAQSAAKDGLRIYTVGIGTAEGELLQIKDANGGLEYIRDEQGNVVKSHLNESLLRQIATAAGGDYYSLSGANTMEELYKRSLGPLPKSDTQEHSVKRPYERYHWPLAVGILLLIAEIFFPERQPLARRKSNDLPPAIGTNVGPPTAIALAIFAFLMLPVMASASPSSAMLDYNAGKFVEAQKEFERLAAADKKGDARFIFNAGDAAFRATNYDVALKCYTVALDSQDVKIQQKAYFNLGNTQFRMGEAEKDLDGMEQQWLQATTNYQNAITLDKKDADAAYNLDFTKKGIVMIEQLREAARRVKMEADSSVRQRQYHRALEILDQAVKKNIAAKPFEDYVKRLKNIDDIATPNQH